LSKWDQLSLSPSLLSSLSKFGVGPPNKIQQRALPFLLRGADIIAQAPPTQERIAAYIIPAIQVVLNITGGSREPPHGPYVVIVSTTVDQATQAQRMIRDLGGPIGVRSALGVGAATSDLSRDLGLLMQNMPHIICGTPQKLHALFTHANGLPGGEVRFLVLDEVDQLIARNIHEYVFNIVKLLPPARRGPQASPLLNSDLSPFETQPSKANSNSSNSDHGDAQGIERQTALFSNTVPQDVLNLASAIQLREPVRVIVRRDGTGSQTESGGGTKGLKQFYIYLAFTASGRAESSPSAGAGPGAIGSGRGSTNAETRQAQEWKLDALGDLFQDVDVAAAIVYVGGMKSLDAVTAKLQTRGVEAVPVVGRSV
jgi:superfamily II DNA/RNA helicase